MRSSPGRIFFCDYFSDFDKNGHNYFSDFDKNRHNYFSNFDKFVF